MAKEVVKESDLVDFVEDFCEKSKHEYLDMQSYINIAYYAGQQWISWDKYQKRLFVPEKKPSEVRLTANRLKRFVIRELAKITKNNPISNVMPASSDDTDIQAAKTADKICQWLDSYLNLPDIDKEWAMWSLTTGSSFIKPFWNDDKGVEVSKGLRQGDIDVDIISLFDFRIDSTAKKWSEVRKVCQFKMRDCDYIEEVYGKKVAPESNIASSNLFDTQLKDLNTLGAVQYLKVENAAIVKEYWELPSKKYPLGRRITIANGVLLFQSEDIGFGPKDKTERELPFFPFIHNQVPGRIWGQSSLEDLIPVQREYNRSRSKIIENIDKTAFPSWTAEEGALVNDIEGGAGEVIEYRRGQQAPKMEGTIPMNADVYRNIDECKDEMEFISGQHDFTFGKMGGIKSAMAIQFLQEEDDTILGPVIANFEQGKAGYMSYMLKIIQQKYDVGRTINLVNKTSEIVAIDFKGEDLTSTQVRIEPGSSLPMSKTAKQNYILGLVGQGILNPKDDKGLILKMLEMGFTDDLYDEYAFDVNYALSEQDKWRKGIFNTTVREFYNHQVHIEEHNKFRMSDDYLKLAEQTQGQSIQAIDAHVNMHEAYALGLSSDEIAKLSQLPVEQQEAMLNDIKIQSQQTTPQQEVQQKPKPPVNPMEKEMM